MARIETRGKACDEEILEAAQPCVWCRQFAQAVTQSAYRGAPEMLERHAPIAELIDCIGCEGRKSAGKKDYADQVGHIGAVDNFVDRSRTHDESRRCRAVVRIVGAVEKVIASQVEDDLDTATGKNALAPV